MAIEKQPSGSPTDVRSEMAQAVTQAANAYNAASAAYKANPTPENLQKQLDALTESVTLRIQQAAVDGNIEGAGALAKLAPEIVKTLKDARAKVRITAADKNVVLQAELFQKQRDLLEKQAKDVFDLSMSGQKTTVSLLGLVKGLAAVFKIFGYDTTDLMKACDDGIRDAKIAAGGIDYAALGKAGLIIDTKSADRQIEGGVGEIVPSIAPAAHQVAKAADGIVGNYQGAPAPQKSKPTTTDGSAPIVVPADVAVDVIKKNAQAAGIKDPQKITDTVHKIAGSDGSLSSEEMIRLNGVLVTATGSRKTADDLTVQIKSKAVPAAIPPVARSDDPAPRPH